MKIAVVGSRTRTDKQSVVDYIDSVSQDDTIISGGCEGVDTWAIEAAMARGLKWKVIYPNMDGAKNYYDRCNRYYDRNEKVAKEAEMVVAFVSKNRKGGTENTLQYAKKYGKVVIVVGEPDAKN
jgi:predicted Rossmann fold nucleotide-binding protein DprA/Smf involved in DNA uptake